jgi:hypothetical protein
MGENDQETERAGVKMARHTGEERPHPIRQEATWVGAVTAVGVLGAAFGVTQVAEVADQAPAIIGSLAAGGVLLQNKVIEKRSEKHVTPTSDPVDDQGNRLVAISPEI